MTERHYLLTETELLDFALCVIGKGITYSASLGKSVFAAEDTCKKCIPTLTPIAPDWSKAPEWATIGRAVVVDVWMDEADADSCMPEAVIEHNRHGNWQPRPEVK